MPAQFSSLPRELRDEIYGFALDRRPRNLEVAVRDGQVVSLSQPPALLHVHRDSRDYVLKIYKPWLPQFAGSPEHAKYAALLSKYRPSRTRAVSCLQNVCFDMERDTLICRTRTPLYRFGRIEESCLRRLALSIDGYLCFPNEIDSLKKAKNLKCLYLFQTQATDGIYYKVERITNGLKRSAEEDRKRPKVRVPNYVAPSIRMRIPRDNVTSWIPLPQRRQRSRNHGLPKTPSKPKSNRTYTWTTYKYPARLSFARPSLPVEVRRPISNSRKRKADTHPEAISTCESMSSERNKRIKMWIRAQGRRKEVLEVQKHSVPVQSVELASMNERIYTKPQISQQAIPSTGRASSSSPPQSEAASSPPQSEAASSPPQSEAASSIAGSDGDSAASESGSEDSRSEGQDSQDEEGASRERIPRQLHAHRFNFDIGTTELLVEWDDSPEFNSWEWVAKADLLPIIPVVIAAFLANNPPLEAGTPVRFHERNSGTVGFDFLVEFAGYPEEIYWTWVPESNMQARVPDMVDEWMAENSSEVEAGRAEESIDEQILAEQNYAEHVRTSEAGDSDVDEAAKQEDPPDADAADADVKDEDAEESTAEYVPKRFVAQRDTPDGPEILVEWDEWPDEKDWTWEPVSNLQEDAPEMVKAWKASRKAKKVSKVYEVDSILGKRKIKGEWHYTVRWKGFAKDEATSLEPCEKLANDVPDLVEAFESRKSKKGRPKKRPSA